MVVRPPKPVIPFQEGWRIARLLCDLDGVRNPGSSFAYWVMAGGGKWYQPFMRDVIHEDFHALTFTATTVGGRCTHAR